MKHLIPLKPLIVPLLAFAALTALLFICFALTLQMLAPRIIEDLEATNHLPQIILVVGLGAGLVYIGNNLFGD